MKRFHVLSLALVAVCAVGVLSAAGASAAVTFLLAEWLENNAGLTATLLAKTTGELLIAETLDGIKIDLLCSWIYVGDVGPNGADDITELLTLSEGAVGEPLVGAGLTCTNDENCAEALAWAEELPWLTLLVLMEDGTETFFADLFSSEKAGGMVAFEFECMSLGLSDLCSMTEAAALVENTAEGLNSEFSEAFTTLAGLKLASCTIAGNEVLVMEGLGLITGDGSALTASE